MNVFLAYNGALWDRGGGGAAFFYGAGDYSHASPRTDTKSSGSSSASRSPLWGSINASRVRVLGFRVEALGVDGFWRVRV